MSCIDSLWVEFYDIEWQDNKLPHQPTATPAKFLEGPLAGKNDALCWIILIATNTVIFLLTPKTFTSYEQPPSPFMQAK